MNKKTDKSQLFALLAAVSVTVALMVTCQNKGTQAVRETPTSGDIKIEADESFRPIVEAQIDTFTSLYASAKIAAEYKPEKDLIADFLNDSVKVLVTAWTPTEEQKALLYESHILVTTTVVAYDALAIVLNRSNNDTLLTYKNVEDIFRGRVTGWNDISADSKLGKVNVIFDNERSCNIRYFKEKFNLPDTLPSNFYAVKSNSEVIDYVSKTPDAMGIVSVNWISDLDDPLAKSFISKVRVAAVSQQYLEEGTYYRPEQGAIYDKSYAFIRNVNMVSRESFAGLGSGFVSFVAGEKGQRIILKSGLVPATMPIRLIQVRKE